MGLSYTTYFSNSSTVALPGRDRLVSVCFMCVFVVLLILALGVFFLPVTSLKVLLLFIVDN